jgi:hypothetical protein
VESSPVSSQVSNNLTHEKIFSRGLINNSATRWQRVRQRVYGRLSSTDIMLQTEAILDCIKGKQGEDMKYETEIVMLLPKDVNLKFLYWFETMIRCQKFEPG